MRMHPLAAAVLGAALVAPLGIPREARANGRFPASNGVVFAPSDDATMMVRVTFGLLVTHDQGRSWRWICERAIGFSGPEDPSYVITKSGAIVAGLFQGIRVSRDGGCTWESVKTDGTVFVDLTLRSDGAVLALASSYDRAGDGGSLFKSQVWISTDDARTFTPLGARLDPTLLAESVEVAPSDPSRVYVSAVRDRVVREGVLLVSTGATATSAWTPHAVTLEGKELAPFIAAVDLHRPGRVFLRTSAPPEQPTRLLVTEDGGKTMTRLLAAKGGLLGFALSDDGAFVHAGGPDDGLHGGAVGPGHGELARLSPLKVQCLARKADALWACAGEASGFVAGTAAVSNEADASLAAFEARLHLRDIRGPIACSADTSVGKECETDWRKLRSDLGLGEPSADPDASAAGDAGVRPRPARGASEDAALTKSPMAWAIGLLALLSLGAYALRKRR